MNPDTMRAVVRSGANLVIYGAPPDLMRELVSLALSSGAHITFRCGMMPSLAAELAANARGQVTFDPMPRPAS